jgi:hypothetical protein
MKPDVYNEIYQERLKQDNKWGEQNHPCLDQVLLNRPGGCTPQRMCENYEIPTEERAKYLTDICAQDESITYAHIAIEEMCEAVSQFDTVKRREELVQLAAVVVAWIEKIDRDLQK